MTSIECGWCNTYSHMTEHGTRVDIMPSCADSRWQQAFTCDNCQHINVRTTYAEGDYEAKSTKVVHVDRQDGPPMSEEWGPRYPHMKGYPDTPEHIADAATEVAQCLAAGTHRAVGAMARAVIEATGKDKNFTVTGIAAKIDAMAAAGLLRPLVAGQAHEVRHFGNDMAHGDFATPTTREEAEEIIALMDEVLREIYQAPAHLARVKVARIKKKSDSGTSQKT